MEKKNNIKKYLIIVLLIISLIINIIMGFFIYKLYNDKTEKPSEPLTKENDKSVDINNYIFELDSKNKYVIITDLRWKTMQNDGGSNTSIYYQIDLDNNIIRKVQEDYYANLGGTLRTETDIIYTKKIDTFIQEEVKSLLTEIIAKEDINDSENYHSFTIVSLNGEKEIYNIDTIENINAILKKIDEL